MSFDLRHIKRISHYCSQLFLLCSPSNSDGVSQSILVHTWTLDREDIEQVESHNLVYNRSISLTHPKSSSNSNSFDRASLTLFPLLLCCCHFGLVIHPSMIVDFSSWLSNKLFFRLLLAPWKLLSSTASSRSFHFQAISAFPPRLAAETSATSNESLETGLLAEEDDSSRGLESWQETTSFSQ